MLLTLVFWIANRCNGKIEVKSKSKGKGKIKGKIKSKGKIKGSGQECPLHTNRNGLRPPKTAKENSNLECHDPTIRLQSTDLVMAGPQHPKSHRKY
jgi:hypothetical protein